MSEYSKDDHINLIREEQKKRLERIQLVQCNLITSYTLTKDEKNLLASLQSDITFPSPAAIGANADLHGFRLVGQLSKEGRRPPSEIAALLHSEVSEFFEGQRLGKADDVKGGAAEEFADIYIRLMDACDEYNIDIAAAVRKKHERNIKRAYLHGKLF